MILGLDISTTIVGVALINDEGNLIVSDHWDISKQETLFEKAEMVGSLLWELKTEHKTEKSYWKYKKGQQALLFAKQTMDTLFFLDLPCLADTNHFHLWHWSLGISRWQTCLWR